jgi:vancomycin permeability regulator SanA
MNIIRILLARYYFKKIKHTFKIICIIFISFFFLHIAYICYDGFTEDYNKADVILVFGTKVNPDGAPSNLLKMRLDMAKKLFDEDYSKTIIVSGGKGAEGFDEADVMYNYLREKGVSEKNLIKDENGTSTYESVKFASAYLKENNDNSILLVSDYYHITRAKLTAKKFGIQNTYGVHADYVYYKDVVPVSREFFAFYDYLLNPKRSFSS